MRQLFFIFVCSIFSTCASAQTMGEVFKQMPDSLLPYLSKNNRLDMIDFMEAKMKAEVTNLLDGTSQMTFLSNDSLSIILNERMQIGMRLIERDSTILALTKVYIINENQVQKVTRYYSTFWFPLPIPEKISSTLLRRDENVFRPAYY